VLWLKYRYIPIKESVIQCFALIRCDDEFVKQKLMSTCNSPNICVETILVHYTIMFCTHKKIRLFIVEQAEILQDCFIWVTETHKHANKTSYTCKFESRGGQY